MRTPTQRRDLDGECSVYMWTESDTCMLWAREAGIELVVGENVELP